MKKYVTGVIFILSGIVITIDSIMGHNIPWIMVSISFGIIGILYLIPNKAK